MMSAFGAAVVTVLCAALLPVTVSLSEECASVRTPCIEQRTIQQSRNLSYCSVTESYDQCVVNALSVAERGDTCNELQLMTYRYDHDVFKLFHGCSYDLVWPSSFQLNTCHREMVKCGRFLLDMDADKCNKLEAFKLCMEQRTTTCNDRQLVDRFLQVELTDYQYDGTCIVGGIPCGVVRSRRRIAGGRPTAPNQFPWVAMLMHNNGFRSSATIIDPLHVITTASRVQDVSVDGTFLNTTDLEVIAGKHWTSTSTRYAGEQRVRVASGMMHERYNMTPGVFGSVCIQQERHAYRVPSGGRYRLGPRPSNGSWRRGPEWPDLAFRLDPLHHGHHGNRATPSQRRAKHPQEQGQVPHLQLGARVA